MIESDVQLDSLITHASYCIKTLERAEIDWIKQFGTIWARGAIDALQEAIKTINEA